MRPQVGALIVATSAIQLANGFFGTFISLRVAVDDMAPQLAGLVLSSYFAGFTIGAVFCERFIARIGHIRAYAALAGLVIAATVAMPLVPHAWPWMALRAVIGVGCAGLFVTTESWLNAKAAPAVRGRVFSIYMVGTFLALALGQILIARTPIGGFEPFNGIAALFAIALVIVCAARADAPQPVAAEQPPYLQLVRNAPIAVGGCAVSGLVTSAFYALVPAWMYGEGIGQGTIAVCMLAAVLGGLVFQIPVGRLSDRFDRRLVVIGVSIGIGLAAAALVALPHRLGVVLPAAAVLGGFMSTLYPVCVAHAHDRMPADRVVAVSGALILISGLGSVAGPLLGSAVKAAVGIDGILYMMAVASLLLAAVTALRTLRAEAPARQARTFDVLAPQAGRLAHDPAGASG